MTSVLNWLFNPFVRGPARATFDIQFVEPPLTFVEYTGVPALFGGSVVPVSSQIAYQGGQAKFITQPTAAAAGKPLTFKNAFAVEFIGGTLALALVWTIVDPKDHRTGGLAERTWYKDNISGWWSLPSSGGYWNTDLLDI